MHTMHPTLLIGPADWDPAQAPREEFAARIAQLWRLRPDALGAVVHGNPGDHAALAYLTHFTPKLEAALALIPRLGAPRLLVGGGVNMIAAARPLTWIEDVVPLRNAGASVEAWLRSLPVPSKPLLINGGAMPAALHREIAGALARAGFGHNVMAFDATDLVGGLMRRNPVAEKEGTAGFELALNFNGIPFELIPRAASEIKGKGQYQLVSVNEAEDQKNPCRHLVARRGTRWELTNHGEELLELLAY